MSAARARPDFVDVSRRLLDVLGAEGLGSEYEQREYAVNGTEPSWVLLPESEAQCAAALRVSAEHGLAVVPAGFGLRLGQGRPPERLDAVLSLSRLDRIVEHPAADMTLTVEAGASLAGVNERLRAAGQWLPFDPPFAARTSIGGLVATQACGPSRQRFGTVRESLIGLRAVLSDGTAVKSGGRVVKNVAGYDLHRLLAGSFGTLAVIVAASFKLRPLPEEIAVVTFSAAAVAPLFDLALQLAGSNLDPLFLELLAGSRTPLLAVGLAGGREEAAQARRRALDTAARGGTVDGAEPLSRDGVGREIEEITRAGDGWVLRAATRPSALGGWLATALERCREVSPSVLAHAHAGAGVARLRLEKPDREVATAVVEELRRAAMAREGYLVIESAPRGLAGELDVWGPPPPSFHLMKGVKAAFDPRRILSPGRFVGGL